MRRMMLSALSGAAALALLSGCASDYYDGSYGNNYGGYSGYSNYSGYGYDPYYDYGYGYGYPYSNYYGAPYSSFGLGLGLGYGGYYGGRDYRYRGGYTGGGFRGGTPSLGGTTSRSGSGTTTRGRTGGLQE
jgi:hypothetical protein